MIIFLIIIWICSVFWGIYNILLYGTNPSRSLGWLLVVICFPILGILIYIVFGINRKEYKFYSLNFNAKRKLYDLNNESKEIKNFTHEFNNETFSEIGTLLRHSSGFPATENNDVLVLKNGKDTFEELFKAISKAEKFIHIQYYILEQGETLNRLLDLLIEKIKSGVEVRILYDALGSFQWKNQKAEKLKILGAKIHPILPLKINTILSTLNYRNHRKIVVIDGTTSFTGGVNVSDKYIKTTTELGIWDDIHLKVEGPIVDHIHRVFIKDFYFASNDELLNGRFYLPVQEKKGKTLAQVVVGGPDLDYHAILHQYSMMIHAAKEKIHIENPYFIPNQSLIEALKMAVLRGVSVTIMVPEINDSRIAKLSMNANFETLLKAGVEICILKNKFSHSKLIVVDDTIASIGSGNFDYRSFEHNYESNIILYNQKIAKELSEDFSEKKKRCIQLNYDTFKKRSTLKKLQEGCAKILSPLL